jgi:hypothetical protein
MSTQINELSEIQIQYLMKRLPNIELSYETIAHKKVFPSYNLGIAVPNGKKFYAWFSFQKAQDVCYLMEINREKKITKVSKIDTLFDASLSLGTILYGTIVYLDENQTGNRMFVIEDIYYYKGISMKNMNYGEKLGYIEDCMNHNITQQLTSPASVVFGLPYMWGIQTPEENDIFEKYDKIKEKISYSVHHIQIRKLNEISPYLNITISNVLTKIGQREKYFEKKQAISQVIEIPKFSIDLSKPQYKYPTIFLVTADIQFDIYHLFAYGKDKQQIYYDVAYIPNIKTSIYMNNIFRKIRENKNLDYIEESDDEADFENISEDKYVDLNKVVNIECVFHTKFKRWVPIRVVNESYKIIHISKLVNYYI